MLTRSTRSAWIGLIAIVALLVLPVAAQASDPGAATISACKPDRITVAGKVVITGKSVRKARGAKLQMRFQALSLFGLPRSGQWRDVGKKLKASGQEDFTGLGADNWIGVLSWRYKKGSRTVLSGNARSQAVKIGRSKGKANCTIAEGAKPVDTIAPSLLMLPADEAWHHAPAQVQLSASDNFSGVKSVSYSLDGGPATPIKNGGTFTIDAEGAHALTWSATDVAGNTATRNATVRVDAAAPTKPTVTAPKPATQSTSPTISWSPSTDSGSGIRGYVVTIQNPDGSTRAPIVTDANTTSAPVALNDNTTYTATVTAVDNTADQPWATNSDPYTFRVDSTPEVTGTNPADGSVLSGGAKSGTFTVNLDRAAQPASVSAALRNVDTNSVVDTTAGCASSACTSLVVDPSGSLPEGRYTLTIAGLKSEEGATFATFVGHYSVPFIDGGSLSAQSNTVISCGAGNASTSSVPLGTSANTETGTLDFDWTSDAAGSWTLQALIGGNPAGGNDQAAGSGAGTGHVHMGPFNLKQGNLTFKLTVNCPDTQVDLTNMVGARVPFP